MPFPRRFQKFGEMTKKRPPMFGKSVETALAHRGGLTGFPRAGGRLAGAKAGGGRSKNVGNLSNIDWKRREMTFIMCWYRGRRIQPPHCHLRPGG